MITSRKAIESSRSRSVRTPGRPVTPGSGRGPAPVAIDETVEADAAAITERQSVLLKVEALRPGPEIELDPGRLEVARRAQSAPVDFPGAREQLLGQRRAVIRQAVLGADQPDAPFEALFP